MLSKEFIVLISERIAKDRNFFVFPFDQRIYDIEASKRMYGKILNAVKFVIGNEMIKLNNFKNEGTLLSDLRKKINHDVSKINERMKLYHEYCRLPYPEIVIENDTGLVYLCEEDGCIKMQFVTRKGLLLHYFVKSKKEADGFSIGYPVGYPPGFDIIKNEEDEEAIMSAVHMRASCIFEVLLILNAVNINIKTYRPSRKEFGKIAKVFWPKFEYRILDIYSERNQYKSITDITDHIRNNNSERRAHLVRGHFKRFSGKLFWWSPHMRNFKNINQAGLIEKDYRLIDNKS